jgi:oligoendopeptidase F
MGTRAGSDSLPKDHPLPRWSLERVYPGLDSSQYEADKKRLSSDLHSLLSLVQSDEKWTTESQTHLERCIRLINEVYDRHENLDAYAYACYSVHTLDPIASREVNAIQELVVPMHTAQVVFRNQLARIAGQLPELCRRSPTIAMHQFFLEEELRLQKHQMSPQEEELAADLARSGADAWSRLQETVSSTLQVRWQRRASRTMVDLRGLAHDPDRSVREMAFRKEIRAWRTAEIPLGFAINGVKGHAVVINRRRGYQDPLDRAIAQARISRPALDALIATMHESLPLFHGYLDAKARTLGLTRLSFYDLFAPVGSSRVAWSFDEARNCIIQQFATFSRELSEFAEHAFSQNWIDAQPRAGKIGGAYCVSMPLVGESRILANFDGSFSSVATIAHELGHAWHHHVLKDSVALHRDYPMTLAETSSIFCETIVFDKTLEAAPDEDKTSILELFLQDSTQVIVDILSRFLFEQELFSRRSSAELSTPELCEMMIAAQKATYGATLDQLHPYMWAVKGHYYRQELSFYNFPYAFGLLFGLGLYARYRRQPAGFPETYKALLSTTGRASAVEVTRNAGFDIESQDFWRSAVGIIGTRIEEFIARAPGGHPG